MFKNKQSRADISKVTIAVDLGMYQNTWMIYEPKLKTIYWVKTPSDTLLNYSIIAKKVKALLIEGIGEGKLQSMKDRYSDLEFHKLRIAYKTLGKFRELNHWLTVHIADQFYPSSKLCFACKNKRSDFSLRHREFICKCGYKMNRDLNACLNLFWHFHFNFTLDDVKIIGLNSKDKSYQIFLKDTPRIRFNTLKPKVILRKKETLDFK
jgi:hypothetical protein